MVLASGGACTLFLTTPSELASTCSIEAPSGVCGACIVENCAPLIDACCGDAECAPLLDTVDDCSEEYVEAYTYLDDPEVCAPLADVDSEPGSLLKTCIAAGCATQCGLAEIATESSGSDCSASYVNACECTATGDAPGNLVSCAPPPGGAVCCAYQAYPAADTRCDCRWFKCGPTADGCACSTSREGSADRCDGEVCCADDSGTDCSCSNDPEAVCGYGETRVAFCTPEISIECPTGEVEVASCSVRRAP